MTPELEIIFDTVKSSRKFQNLISNSGCSFVFGWAGEITVQYEGQANQPDGAALAHYQDVYFADGQMSQPPELARHHVFRGATIGGNRLCLFARTTNAASAAVF